MLANLLRGFLALLLLTSAAAAQTATTAPAEAPPAKTGEAGQAATPSDIIGRLNDTLLYVMKNAETLGYQGRYDRLGPVLTESFDFPVMARISVGGTWKTLSDDEKRQLVDSFTRMSIATFASRFNGYEGEVMEVLGEEEAPRRSILVRNQLIMPDGETIPLNYLLRKSKNGWRAVDVYLDAKFSELAIKRSEYGSVIKRDGFEGLITTIEKKIKDLEQDPADKQAG